MKTVVLVALVAIASPAFALTNDPAPASLLQWMERVVVPAAEFRNANSLDVLSFLFEASQTASSESTRSLGLIYPEDPTDKPKTIHVFETEDGSPMEVKSVDVQTRCLTMLQTADLLCELSGIHFTAGPAGPEFFLSDGRRLVRKEVPAPPPEIPSASSDGDDWGFGDQGGLARVHPDAIDWEPLYGRMGAYETTPEQFETTLTQMGFDCTRHAGSYSRLMDSKRDATSLHPMACILGERVEGETLWRVWGYITEDGRLRGMAIHPHPGF